MIVREYHEEVSFMHKWVFDKQGNFELMPEIADRTEEAGYSLNEIGITHIDTVLEKYENV